MYNRVKQWLIVILLLLYIALCFIAV